MISLKGNELNGQMLIQTIFAYGLSGDYPKNIEFIKGLSNSYKVFEITSDHTKEVFSKTTDIDSQTIQYIIKDKCYVSRLCVRCEQLLDWIIQKINDNSFPAENLDSLIEWLKKELDNKE